MSKQLTPEQAQQKTENTWRKRAAGLQVRKECAWCIFSGCDCLYCPISMVTGCSCEEIPQYRAWHRAIMASARPDKKKAAAAILESLVANREPLIAAGHEILAERKR